MRYLQPAAVANGIVYAGSMDGKVYADLDAATGAEKWNYTTGNYVMSSPAVANGVVYVGSWDSRLYALDAATGALKWSFTTGSAVHSQPGSSKWCRLCRESGWPGLRNQCSNRCTEMELSNRRSNISSPAIANGVVYVGSHDGRIYAINAVTGEQIWTYQTFAFLGNSGVLSSPAVADGVVYVGSRDGKVYARGTTNPPASLVVNSTPTGAKIFLDNTDTGHVTPYTFPDIQAGSHNVYVTLSRYTTPEPQIVPVTGGQTATADFVLVEVPPEDGQLEVTSTPSGAEIFLNGANTGNVTPYTFTKAPGDYQVSVTLSGYVTPSTEVVPVISSQVATAVFTLVRQPDNRPPVANAGQDRTVFVNEVVMFDGSGSSDPDGTVVTYSWDFGDTHTASGVSVSNTFTTAGRYTVTLTVTDNEGLTGLDTSVITVKTSAETLQDLIYYLDGIGLPSGIENGLMEKLQMREEDHPGAIYPGRGICSMPSSTRSIPSGEKP